MSQTIVCSFCEKEFTPAADDRGMWLICPHCAGRTPNPLAFDKGVQMGRPLSGFGVLGTLVMFFAIFGTVVSGFLGFCLFTSFQAVFAFFGFLAALAAGITLVRMDRKTRGLEGKLAGQTVLAAGLVFLAALGAMSFALATCFSGTF